MIKMIAEMVKQKCFRLMVLLLISVPLMVCYPIVLILGVSPGVSSFAVVLLSVVVYVLSALKHPSLWQNLSESIQLDAKKKSSHSQEVMRHT